MNKFLNEAFLATKPLQNISIDFVSKFYNRHMKIIISLYLQVKSSASATAAQPKTWHKVLKAGMHERKFNWVKGLFICVFLCLVVKFVGYLILFVADLSKYAGQLFL